MTEEQIFKNPSETERQVLRVYEAKSNRNPDLELQKHDQLHVTLCTSWTPTTVNRRRNDGPQRELIDRETEHPACNLDITRSTVSFERHRPLLNVSLFACGL